MMVIRYRCRHCGDKLGEVGFEHYERIQASLLSLMEEERLAFLYNNGDGITITVICESCQKALEENPHYYGLEHDTFLQ